VQLSTVRCVRWRLVYRLKADTSKNSEIEILRALSIIIVLFGHLPFPMPNVIMHGYTGVTLFFVISGFVVTKSLLAGNPDTIPDRLMLQNFYIKRLFRIIPSATMWVALYFAFSQIIVRAGGSYGTIDRWQREITWYVSGIYNYHFAFSRGPGLFGHYWSLFVEIHFYLIMPFIFIFFRTFKARLAACVAGMVLVIFIFRPLSDPAYAALMTHTQCDGLIAGVMIFLLASKMEKPAIPAGSGKAAYVAAWMSSSAAASSAVKLAVFLPLFVFLWLIPAWLDTISGPAIKYPVYVAAATLLVYLAQLNAGWISFKIASMDRFLVYVGSRSFAIYVSHVILFSGAYYNLYMAHPEWYPTVIRKMMGYTVIQTIFLFGLALAVADLSYRLVEKPFIILGSRFLRKGKTPIATT
jgi:peptidoglycan/LPS O-acetylase OafA/YrhL